MEFNQTLMLLAARVVACRGVLERGPRSAACRASLASRGQEVVRMGIENQQVSRSEVYYFVPVLECSDTCSGCITLLFRDGMDKERESRCVYCTCQQQNSTVLI